ncbi:peptidoglycan-binding protein [Microvirga sp. 17 mud 1-3]|uniref:peptidoglycan-binding protein n=1 Tax=Microvirga sp. 17 mud 1-3 TaxID=2082949 RepID=UPI000D6C11BE|nr:peptidoglycan-binding protein [Microvirga sp. 17 mud 1-3]AWM86098.1 hypothetical protein C4E04_04650 [Microvirga sp. 17 mud 1-3]
MVGPFQSSMGRTIRISSVLGRGGEGIVYSVDGDPDKAAKIYLPGLADERKEKILAMVAAGWHKSAGFVAFPTDALFSASGSFVGFTMRKVGGNKAVHELYSPTGRKTAFPTAGFPFLVRTAANVARAVAAVHATGCVIGDVNHSGVLIGQNATVTLIDSDSFQVISNGHIYPCKVGVPEFTPPELQGKRLDQVHRSVNHDAFGLATLIFNLLFMGRHPFSGRYLGAGDMPMPRAIEEFRFAYSARRSATQMEPPPNVPTLADLPLSLSDAFEQAFGPVGVSKARRSAAEWVSLLDQAERELAQCSKNSGHHYFRVAKSCPWCRMEKAFPGFIAFSPTRMPQQGGKPFDIGQLISAIRSVPDPGPIPDLQSLVTSPSALQPSATAIAARKEQVVRWAVSAVGAIIGLVILATNWIPSILGLLVMGGSAAWGLAQPSARKNLNAAAANARSNWLNNVEKYESVGGNERFLKLRQDAEALITQAQGLSGEEARRIAGLDSKRRSTQMRRHLEKYPIAKSGAKGIGASRLLTLRSYGIETAADVDRRRIESIPTFGPSLANGLIVWRQKVEARFVFDPSQPLDPADVLAIKSDIAKRGADLEKRVHQAYLDLQNAHTAILSARTGHANLAKAAWESWKQAEADVQEVEQSGHAFKKVMGLALIAVVTGIFVWAVIASQRTKTQQNTTTAASVVPSETKDPAKAFDVPPDPTPAPVPPISPPSASAVVPEPSGPAIIHTVPSDDAAQTGKEASSLSEEASLAVEEAAPSAPADRPTPPVAVPPLPDPVEIRATPTIAASENVELAAVPSLMNLLSREDAMQIQSQLAWLGYFDGVVDGIWGPRSRHALRQFRQRNKLGADDQWNVETQSTLMGNAALRAPSNSISGGGPWNGPEATLAPPVGATRNPLNRADAVWVQERLRQLGFYRTINGEGVWGIASRDALRDFKTVSNLPPDDTWDAVTESSLKSAFAIKAEQTFVGTWAISPNSCAAGPGGTPPLKITSQRAEALGGVCTFERLQNEGGIWRTTTQCTEQGKSWSLELTLRVNGRTLIWSNGQGATTYYRC